MNTSDIIYDPLEKLIIESKLRIASVKFDLIDGLMLISLSDGSTLHEHISNHKRLVNADEPALTNWRLIGSGTGVHWPDLDEDLSLKGFLKSASHHHSHSAR